MNYSMSHVFICENNFYEVDYEPIKRRHKNKLQKMDMSYGKIKIQHHKYSYKKHPTDVTVLYKTVEQIFYYRYYTICDEIQIPYYQTLCIMVSSMILPYYCFTCNLLEKHESLSTIYWWS